MTRSAVLQRQGGRRIKKVPKGERTQIGVIVERQDQGAAAQSHAGERAHNLARGRAPDREGAHLRWLVAAQKRTLEEMERGNVEAALHRLGYPMQRQIIDGKVWRVWTEPGYPGAHQPGSFPERTK